MRFRGLAAATIAGAMLWAAPALAVTCPLINSYVLRDGNVPQVQRSIAAIVLAFPDCRLVPTSVPVDPAGNPLATAAGTPASYAIGMQGITGGVPINVNLATGASTSAAQTTAQSTLTSILAKSTAIGQTATNGDGVVTGGATAATISAPGGSASHSYAPGDTATLTGGTETSNAVLTVTNTQVVSATVAAGGTGGTNGTQTVTGTTGTGTKFQASVTVSGNAITAVLSITVHGNYTVNPTSLAAEPVTGASLTGAQLNVVMGALTASVTTPGLYSAVPSNPVSQGASSGVGLGTTFTMTFAPIAQVLFGGATPANGFKVGDPNLSDDLWISDSTTTPTVNGAHSQKVWANGGQYATEPWEKPVGPVYLIGPTIGDVFTARGS